MAQLTGVQVQESVPDSFFAAVSDVELVDIPPDELITRLQSGKIYAPEKIDSALNNFFQKENLIALHIHLYTVLQMPPVQTFLL